MVIIINPGTGPVSGATAEEAYRNLGKLAEDVDARGCNAHRDEAPLRDQGDGRWEGTLVVDGKVHLVEMPGLPLERVRYLGEEDQNIWDFPRLYVDGSSWVWKFAVNVLAAPDDDD